MVVKRDFERSPQKLSEILEKLLKNNRSTE